MSAASLSPQALAEACAKAMWDDDNATRHLGMELLTIAPGEATITMTIAETMTNGHGTCHGGYIFTLADSAFAFACNTYNQRTVAQHCSVTYIAPAFKGDRLTATAREVSRRGRPGSTISASPIRRASTLRNSAATREQSRVPICRIKPTPVPSHSRRRF